MSRPVPMVIVAAVAALAIAGCGDEVIDDGEAEDFVQDGLQQSKVKVDSVECPSDVDVEKGKSFECAAETNRGGFTVTLRMLDDDGTIRPTDIKPVK